MRSLLSNLQKGRTLIDYFYYWEQQQPDKVYLRQPEGHHYRDFTWGEVGRQARTLATYLNSLGLPPGSHVGLVSRNCAHWIIADLAILLSGHVSVPIYPTLNADQFHRLLTFSHCKALFVGKTSNWPAMKPGIPNGIHCIELPDFTEASPANPEYAQWNTILEQYEPMTDNRLPHPDDLYTIIFTSGTAGTPKGVMIDFKATTHAIDATKPVMHHDEGEARFFSYLPLCHVAERNISEATSLITGGTVYFSESPRTFNENLATARPTHFLAVPRIWANFQQAILARIPQEKLDRQLRMPIIGSLVKRRLRQALGLNDARLILTGAAPMPVSLIRWFRRLGIMIQEAYGMTENLGTVSMMPPDHLKDGSVGKLHPGVEVRIDPATGEIATRCDWTMRGYYREPALTATVLDPDGWLHTGDVGTLDEDGYLTITGRVKDIYKTPRGEYVAPAQIEYGFADNTFIEQICVAGQQLPQPIALIVLSETGRRTDPELVSRSLEQTVNALNPQLHTYERIKKVVIVKEPWTVDNNLITPSLKIRRSLIESRYEPHLQPWFEQTDTVIWEG